MLFFVEELVKIFIPISSANTKEEVYKLNHYTNFQPLYWRDNLIKGNRY